MKTTRFFACLLLLVGCEPEEGEPERDSATRVLDCSELPAVPLSETTVQGAPGFHGVAFDLEGRMVGSDGRSLIKTDSDGQAEVWVPAIGVVEQMQLLPGGDLVVSTGYEGPLERITPEGGRSVISPDLFAYSVVLGPDGMIYSAGSLGVEPQGVVRIDPETGERTELAMFPPGGAARSLGFSVDASRLYIGTAGYERGVIYVLELDDQLDPVGSPEIFVEDAGDGWQDAIAVDACDNLYVPDSHALRLYRVSPDGDAQVYVDWTAAEERYGHDARFGPPRGGWRTDALYMPTPYGDKAMKELVIGVPSREFAGEVLNRP